MTSISSRSIAIAAVAGAMAGMHAAIWGMYKDAIYEGFATDRFLRSVILGALCGVGVQALLRLPVPDPGSFVMLVGLAYATERGIVEVWKTFLRDEDQAKYTIPTRLTVLGVPVRSRLARFLAGLGYVVVIALCLLAIGNSTVTLRCQGECRPGLRASNPRRYRDWSVGVTRRMLIHRPLTARPNTTSYLTSSAGCLGAGVREAPTRSPVTAR